MRAFWLAGFLLVSGAAAQIVPGEYIVELAGDPAIPAAPVKGPRPVAARASVRAMQARVQTALQDANIEVIGAVDTVLNALMVRTGDASTLGAIPGVARVYPVRLYKPVMDRAVVLQKVTAAGAYIGGSENAGAGIKIGIIDSGVDAAHPAFRDDGFVLPAGYPKVNKSADTRYTNRKVIVARNYDRSLSATAEDKTGHGTAVAAVAAGVLNTGPNATFTGVAPKAYLGSYKVFPDDAPGAPDRAILEALNDAVNDGMDVVNLSLGSFPAQRTEDDPVVRAVENAIRAGVVVVIAAGNEGPGLATVASPATAPSAIAVGASLNDRLFAAGVWLDGLDPLVGLPGSASGAAGPVRAGMRDATSIDPTGLLCGPLPEGSLTGVIVLIRRGECYFEEKLNFAQQAGAIAAVVATDASRPGSIVMETGAATLPAMMIDYAAGLLASERLRLGSAEVQLEFQDKPIPVNSADLAGFTSKGPSVDLRIKPDLLAIGTSVYTAQPGLFGAPRYRLVQGTSFSAPMISGAAALLKAFRPGLSVEQYKSLLVNSASTFLAKGGGGFPMQQTGAGLLDVAAAVQLTVTATPASVGFGTGSPQPGSTQRIVLKNLGAGPDTFSIVPEPRRNGPAPSVTPDVVDIAPGGTAELAVRWNASGLTPGAHEGFLVVRGTRTDAAARIPYWYAVTTGVASSIDVVEAPGSGAIASRHEFYVRALDTAGVPVMSEPRVTIPSQGAGAQVEAVEPFDREYPGFYRVRVSLSSQPGANVFDIEMGGAKVRVTINGV